MKYILGCPCLVLFIQVYVVLLLQVAEVLGDGLVDHLNPVHDHEDCDLVRGNAFAVKLCNVSTHTLNCLSEHGLIFAVHADADG